jgi:DNA-directed RNA polymerase beta subunit
MFVDIVNPNYKVNEENNIFLIREKEYAELENNVREILRAAEDSGFAIAELEIRDPKFLGGELKRTARRNLIIKLKKGSLDIDLSMAIPKLIDKNYIIIGGRKKIPLFQLFDIPVVTRGKTIKIRTNVASMMIIDEKTQPFINLSILNRKVPLSLVLFAYYGMEEIKNRYELDKIEITETNTLYDKLLSDLKDFYEGSEGYEKEDFIKEVGRYYTATDPKSKGEDLIYALDLILKTDIASAKFFKTKNILDEIVEVIKIGKYDDTDLKNKRIRCFEYIVLAKISKAIFDLCMLNRSTSKQLKFNVNSRQILSDCNISDIVQFDFSINPIEELTKLTRTSLVGPGGFDRENVSEYLRDINPSMFGRICPVDTPDRDNCGVLQSVLPNVKFDENLRFSDEICEKSPISIPVSMVPFLRNDDQTRLQMSSSQMRQAIMLSDFDSPLIQSGCEGTYSDYTRFVKKARKNGKVTYVDAFIAIVVYDDNDYDIFDISNRRIYVENTDLMNIYVSKGDKVKKGEIIAESNYCKNGKINFGKNLLTAVMPYYGYNYEDSIVISDRLLKENVLTSIHCIDLSFTLPPDKILLSIDENTYKPLPNPMPYIDFYDDLSIEEKKKKRMELIPKGNPYAILKEMPPLFSIDYSSVFEEKIPLIAKKNILITEVNIYPNRWNTSVPKFDDWVKNKLKDQENNERRVHQVLYENLPKKAAEQYIKDHNLDQFINYGKFKIKGDEIKGMLIEIFGVYSRPITIGDKIGNRHGNKGVISKIVPHNLMPKLEDGRNVDICINPLGVPSRMNIGQIFELHAGMSVYDLKNNILKMMKDGKSQDELKTYILDYIKIIDNTEGNWYYKQFEKQLKTINKKFVDDLFIIAPPFESSTREQILKACEYTNTKMDFTLHEPIEDVDIPKIACGFIYFFRMVHIAEGRLAARGIGAYARRTMQPGKGRKNKGGQRAGEMEVAAIIAHGGLENLHEFLTTKSDCIDLKNKHIKTEIGSEFFKEKEDETIRPEAVALLKAYLTVLGIDLK